MPRALAAAAVGAGVKFHYDTPVERILLARRRRRPGRRCRARRRRAHRHRRRGGQRRPPGRVRHPAARTRAHRVPCAAELLAVRASSGTSAAAATCRPPSPHHNIHFGRDWDGSFRALIDDGTRMPDPSMLVTVPTVDDRRWPRPAATWSTRSSRCPTSTAGSTGRTSAAARPARRAGGRRRLPGRRRGRGARRPVGLAAPGHGQGTPFALAHRFFQTGPFRPGNVERRAPGLFFVGSATVPGVGVPMVLVSGRLAAQRSPSCAR